MDPNIYLQNTSGFLEKQRIEKENLEKVTKENIERDKLIHNIIKPILFVLGAIFVISVGLALNSIIQNAFVITITTGVVLATSLVALGFVTFALYQITQLPKKVKDEIDELNDLKNKLNHLNDCNIKLNQNYEKANKDSEYLTKNLHLIEKNYKDKISNLEEKLARKSVVPGLDETILLSDDDDNIVVSEGDDYLDNIAKTKEFDELCASFVIPEDIEVTKENKQQQFESLYATLKTEDLNRSMRISSLDQAVRVPDPEEEKYLKNNLQNLFFKGGIEVFNKVGRGFFGGGMTLANFALGCVGVAERGFTTNAPAYKQLQVSGILTNMQQQISKELSVTNWDMAKKQILERVTKNEHKLAIQKLLNLRLVGLTLHGYTVDAPKQRSDFLKQLKVVCTEINYEGQIDDFFKCPSENRWKLFPQIKVLHLMAKHLTETPVWNLASDEIGQRLDYMKRKTTSLSELFERDVAIMKEVEKHGVMDKPAINCEKLGMQNGNGFATNDRYNYPSLLGLLKIAGKDRDWLRMGTPTLDVGSSGEPAKLTNLYTLYLDYHKDLEKQIGFFGLQQAPDFDGTNFTGFVLGDYEKNRTASFMQALQNPRWKGTFHFANLSMDDIEKNDILKLKKTKHIADPLKANDYVKCGEFKFELRKLMGHNLLGLYGISDDIAKYSVNLVQNVFFEGLDDELLSDEQRWAFLILTYAIIIQETITTNDLDTFHVNCKDGMDRATVVNTSLLMLTALRKLSDPGLENQEKRKIMDDLSTMFNHPAFLIKEQAVIPSRAPIMIYVMKQVENVLKKNDVDARLYALFGNQDTTFTPFKTNCTYSF
jgi:hypothetical protein